MKNTVLTLKKQKQENNKITMLTCYDYSTAKLMDEAGVECLLIGDSLGMVMLGYEDTLSVTVDDIIHHSAAVARGAKNAFVIADMPFMSYNISVEDTLKNAARIMKEGRAQALKLEGGAEIAEQVRALTNAQIPVVGHLGLTPQAINALGGFKVQGKDAAAAQKILDDARALEAAGAVMITLECVPAMLAKKITESVGVPTIGIGGGKFCDGQVLVWQDMVSIYGDMKPKFVKQFADAGTVIKGAFKKYIEEVKSGAFPAEEHSFTADDSVISKLY